MEDKTLRAAPFFPRAAAYLLDRLILGAVLFIPKMIAWARSLGTDALSRAVLFRFSWEDILFWALGAAYFTALTALTGSTLGKKAMGLTVVDMDGNRPGFLTVLHRETWARYLSSILYIGYILCAVDHEHGALHDRICDTRVVYAPPKAALLPVRASSPRIAPAALPAAGETDWYAPNL